MRIQMGRRRFLGQAAGLCALSATAPSFLLKTGRAFAGDPKREIAPIPGLNDNRVLVVVQLAGGNDGLNTLPPHGDDIYYKARPKLAIPADRVLKIDDRIGMHPELLELRDMLEQQDLAVVSNVGYPNPDRSHFRSSEIWETASPAEKSWTTGWLGRYFDNECSGARSPMLGFQLGERPAQSFASPKPRAVALANPAILEWPESGPFAKGLGRINRPEPTGIAALDFVQRAANDALTLSQKMREVVQGMKTGSKYPPFAFSQSLKLVSRMIAAEMPARIYYVSHGGFDTHAAQSNRHSSLLQELSQGLRSFRRDLKSLGHWDRTLVMTFSEFGRRVAENRSGGTDHGTANAMLLMGGGVRPGIHGAPPDLAKLDESGDLIHKTDFRSVYAGVLADWLGADADQVLGGRFEPLPLFAKNAGSA